MLPDRGYDSEATLVPLLDLVLQLVMFFMMCANFVMEQVDQTIMLPVAQSAKPMSETGSDIVFLNIDQQGQLLLVGRPEPLTNETEIATYLQGVAEDGKRRAAEHLRRTGGDPSQARADTLIIIRAHREADYAAVYQLMRRCQDYGLRKLQLRATIGGAGR